MGWVADLELGVWVASLVGSGPRRLFESPGATSHRENRPARPVKEGLLSQPQ